MPRPDPIPFACCFYCGELLNLTVEKSGRPDVITYVQPERCPACKVPVRVEPPPFGTVLPLAP